MLGGAVDQVSLESGGEVHALASLPRRVETDDIHLLGERVDAVEYAVDVITQVRLMTVLRLLPDYVRVGLDRTDCLVLTPQDFSDGDTDDRENPGDEGNAHTGVQCLDHGVTGAAS